MTLPLALDSLPSVSRFSTSAAGAHTLRVAGLFAGIGGIELGLHEAGHATVLLCESDPAARAVLAARFPGIGVHEDVRTLEALPESTTMVAAGFPCQDLSQAGQTSGIAGTRSSLVGEVLRLVERHRTPWVLLENVPFMLQLARGNAMNVLTSAFEELGYSWAYRVVDARAFGLPQRRRRVYFIASCVGDPRSVLFADEAGSPEAHDHPSSVAYGFYWTEGIRGLGWAVDAIPTLKGGSTIGIPSSPAIVLSDGRLVTLDIRDAERLQGFSAGWTEPAEAATKKGGRWRLVGNAVSVRAAAWIARRLREPGEPLEFPCFPLMEGARWPTSAWNVGQGRFAAAASEWPVRRPYDSLETFLKFEPSLLSAKATAGFLQRTTRARLRFPEGFLDTVRTHLSVMQQRQNELLR